jgi:hypothetical protein
MEIGRMNSNTSSGLMPNTTTNMGEMTMSKLLESHEAEAENQQAEFYNFGQATDENYIESKTSKGRLLTTVDPKTMLITHEWRTYAECSGPWELAQAAANYRAAADGLDKVGNSKSAERHRRIAYTIEKCLKDIGENPAEFREICDRCAGATVKEAV